MVEVSEKKNQVEVEREALLAFLAQQRAFLLTTLQGLTEEQATRRTTASELTLAGIVKHLSSVENGWRTFVKEGPQEVDYESQETQEFHENSFRLIGEETLEGTLTAYERGAEETDAYFRSLPHLEISQKLPPAPWFPEDASWTARDVLIHLIRETAQHCGHADVIRESLDGQKTMG
ncbi:MULTISPECIES: DinB family protein [unclassified Nocardiopsis]|uniref:DinB family protein n=1 Tax=unclassified Nocardiopsis TaxID=2649073 RepID=UPI00066D37F5|nr:MULTISPECIES: DinB family protein [unclassified Nocardiopsis]MBQ1083499.1 DinB family protein [Nocardiopsis sp. B62]